MNVSPTLRAALWYASRLGLPVLPGDSIRKRPLPELGTTGRHHLAVASRDPRQIIAWWQRWPSADPAVPTAAFGAVLDIDYKPARGINGYVGLELIEDRLGQRPDTVRLLTPSGGMHEIYGHGTTMPSGNAVGVLARGVDVLVTGLEFLPPSRGRMWFCDAQPDETPIAPWPTAWTEILRAAQRCRVGKQRVELPETIASGSRNETLFNLLVACRRDHGLTSEQVATVADRVNRTRCRPPLPPRTIKDMVHRVVAWRPSA